MITTLFLRRRQENQARLLIGTQMFSRPKVHHRICRGFSYFFPKSFIFPTAYSLRSPYDADGGRYSHAKIWNAYGIYEGDEDNEANWELLATNETSESNYCNVVDSDGYCNSKDVGSFTLKPYQSSKGFKYLRWRYKVGSPSKDYYFSTSAIDVYGTLSSSSTIIRNKKGNTCFCRCSVYRFLITALASNLMRS